MANYDEDLFENPFFLAVHKQFTGLFNKAIAEKALLCVPKYATCVRKSITQADVEDHILIPDNADYDDNLYKTVSGKMVLIADGALKTTQGFELQQSVHLLFEETFHSENDNSYRVLCIDHFLSRPPETASSSKDDLVKQHSLTTYEQCLDLLWNHAGGQKTRDSLDKLLNIFAEVYDTLEGESLRSVVDMGGAHFTKAMQFLLKDSVVRRSVKHNPSYMDNLKVAVETYLMNAIHVRVFRVVTAVMASEDAEINKMTRNLAALQLQDLGIRKIFSQNIPPAKKELARLNQFSTPLGRLFCIKRVVTALTRPLKHLGKTDNSTTMMTTDDFLPILIFLIIKSEIPNWMANLVYMRHFHFAKSGDDDEFGFYLASIEAALEHIKSGDISKDMKINKQHRDRAWSLLEFSPTHTENAGEGTSYQKQMSVIDNFFKNVQDGYDEEVRRLLQQPQRSSEEVYLKLCHPLCSCDKCDKVLASTRSNSNLVTAYTRDNRGYTALHMAAYYGQGKVIDLLVQSGAVVDATDYLGLTPLHLACQRGYQNVMFLLLHFGADLMARDNENNTPLHHCCVNGHEECVKALVFYDAAIGKLQVNACNEFGDTPLHMAAKWGYENIVKMLLENGANAMIKNRKRQSPVHVAQNVKVQRLLQQSVDGLEMQPVSTFTSVSVGMKKSPLWTPSLSGVEPTKHDTLTETLTETLVANSDMDDVASSRVETASLDEVQDRQLKKRKDKLFKAIVSGDIQLVKFYLGIEEDPLSTHTDEEDAAAAAGSSVDAMCHPLCQCPKCLSIQKERVKAHQSLSVSVKTTAGYTPLHMSVLHGHDDLTCLFLKHGAHVNSQNHKNLTPLHIAVCLKKTQVMQMLLERGARLNIRDINGDTPLLICSASGYMEGVQALLQRGADVNATNYHGNTALHEAADHCNFGIIRMLLDAGADPTVRNKVTKTATNMARDPQTEKLLQNAAADWKQEHTEHRPRVNSQRVVANTQVKVQELFAAFEQEDLRTLQSLTAAIRTFHKEGSLRKTVTRDNTNTLLDSLTHAHFIESFDQSSLRHVKPKDKSRPLYIYSLASSAGGTSKEEENMADMSGENIFEEDTDSMGFISADITPEEEELFGASGSSHVDTRSENPQSAVECRGSSGTLTQEERELSPMRSQTNPAVIDGQVCNEDAETVDFDSEMVVRFTGKLLSVSSSEFFDSETEASTVVSSTASSPAASQPTVSSSSSPTPVTPTSSQTRPIQSSVTAPNTRETTAESSSESGKMELCDPGEAQTDDYTSGSEICSSVTGARNDQSEDAGKFNSVGDSEIVRDDAGIVSDSDTASDIFEAACNVEAESTQL